MFVTVNPKNTYKVEFPDNLWLPLIYQPQSDEIAFEIILFGVYKNISITWKNEISVDDIVRFNEQLENISKSPSSYENMFDIF